MEACPFPVALEGHLCQAGRAVQEDLVDPEAAFPYPVVQAVRQEDLEACPFLAVLVAHPAAAVVLPCLVEQVDPMEALEASRAGQELLQAAVAGRPSSPEEQVDHLVGAEVLHREASEALLAAD